MRSVLAYTAARLLLFGVASGLLYLLGARGALALILGALVSGLVSYILLSGQRDAVSARITARTDRMSRRLEEGAAHEDGAQAPVTTGENASEGSEGAEGAGSGHVGADAPDPPEGPDAAPREEAAR